MVSAESPATKQKVRIVNIYSTGYVYSGDKELPLNQKLVLGTLAEYYDLYRVQLPRLLPESFLAVGDSPVSIALAENVPGVTHLTTEVMLFALPSNQVILAVGVAFDCPLRDLQPIVATLEQGIEGGIVLNGEPLDASLRTQLSALPDMKLEGRPEADTGRALLPERHQLVFIRRSDENEPVPSADTVHTIVYRETPPLTEEFARPKIPEQLNQVRARSKSLRQLMRLDDPVRSGQEQITLGVVTPYVSLLFGHQEYIEESVLLSSVHAVGTASKFRQIWADTYEQVRQFRRTKQEQETGRQTRDSFEELADRLGNLEFDLTFSVEFPQLRIESFQAALYEAMDLSTQARTLSDMFTQVANSVRSEITAITVREQRINEGRHQWNAFASGILSLLGVSVGFVIAFLGINTLEVPSGDHEVSMWSSQFADVYLIAGLFALVPVFFISFPYLREWAGRGPRQRALWAGVLGLSSGLVLLFVAILIDDIFHRQEVVDALLKSLAVSAFIAGLSLAGLYLSRRLVGRRRTAVLVLACGLSVAVLSGIGTWYLWSHAPGTVGRLGCVALAAVCAIAGLAAIVAAIRAVWQPARRVVSRI